MALPRRLSFKPGYFAQAFDLIPNSVEGVGISDRLRDACQKGWTERDRQRRNGRMVDPALDRPREIVKFGKDRAKRPADSGVATIWDRRSGVSSG